MNEFPVLKYAKKKEEINKKLKDGGEEEEEEGWGGAVLLSGKSNFTSLNAATSRTH